ncbi:MAG: multiheme c-type cytochrome [Stenotrophobium sp.]
MARHPGVTHLGVVSCAQSTCHGSASAWATSSVNQNEYFAWRDHDPHAKAYEALTGKKGRAIAARLGGAAASDMPLCLGCHTDNVPVAQRGEQFNLDRGIDCESCHGGAQKWIGLHYLQNADLSSMQSLGMYPTWEPKARAALCVSCHEFGARGGDHRLMAAGHPRFPDDLAAYLQKWPKHYTVDDDYIRRKHPVTDSVQTGLYRLQHAIDWSAALAASEVRPRGILPEFSFLRCNSCHRAAKVTDSNLIDHPQLNDAALRDLLTAPGAIGAPQRTEIERYLKQLSQALAGGSRTDYTAAAVALHGALPKREIAGPQP